MTQREIKLRAVIAWCMACGWSVTDFHMLFSRIYNVIHYRKMCTITGATVVQSMAASSRDDAIEDLHEFMRARCFPDEIRRCVVWLYDYSKGG